VDYLLVLAVGLVAGTLSGIVGFGSSIMMMPVLVVVFGPRQAVPIMAIAAILANLSRVVVWWREVDWRACAAYSATAVPGAMLGAKTLLVLPPRVVEGALGALFIALIPLRRRFAASNRRFGAGHLAALGLPIGFLTGVVASTGPITVPIFLAYGLVKGAFLATEALSSLAMYVSKAVVFRALDALPADIVAKGLLTGSSLMVGAFVAKRHVLKMPPERFRLLMDGLMLAAGIAMLWAAADFG
jgi:uncharacterized membrane protein YfcA